MKKLQNVTIILFVFVASVSLCPSQVNAQSFDCDFDGMLEEFQSSDYSCDYSVDGDGSFDVSCDYSIDDDLLDMSSSGSFDASCDAIGNDTFSCDSSISYDYDAPGISISESSSCDSVNSSEYFNFTCGEEITDPNLTDLISAFNITCGVPQGFDSIISGLVDDREKEIVASLAKMMIEDVKKTSLRKKRKITRQLKGLKRDAKRGRTEKAQARIVKAKNIIINQEPSQETLGQLSATSLYPLF